MEFLFAKDIPNWIIIVGLLISSAFVLAFMPRWGVLQKEYMRYAQRCRAKYLSRVSQLQCMVGNDQTQDSENLQDHEYIDKTYVWAPIGSFSQEQKEVSPLYE